MTKLAKTAAKSFVTGLTTFMNIWPQPLPSVPVTTMSMNEAIGKDWQKVGESLQIAMRDYGKRRGAKISSKSVGQPVV